MNEFAQKARQPDAKLRRALRASPQFGVGLRLTFGSK
ncbi:MAG: hypothetical protein N838_28175 [Thiohalocapsa sp. PB-PSB1]|jgi:hypothetical protein|nr:MAG: hypothetical protein N838_28175 [Thiohalocapsa sp. PB-PSB1]